MRMKWPPRMLVVLAAMLSVDPESESEGEEVIM